MGNNNSDDHISIFGAISLYHHLLKTKKIKENGAAHKRMRLLEFRYRAGDKYFPKISRWNIIYYPLLSM